MGDGTAVRIATPALLEARLADVRASLGDRAPNPLIVGVRARPQWNEPAQRFGGQDTRVEACATPLGVRSALERFGRDGASSTLMVLTDLSEEELGDDLLGRFWKPSLISLNPWAAVRLCFDVRRLDPAFAEDRLAWMADALLAMPLDGAPTPTGVLTVEAALGLLAGAVFGADGLSLEQLLVATGRSGFGGTVGRSNPTTVAGLCDTLARQGPAAALVLGAIALGNGAAALPGGLAASGLESAGPDHLAVGRIEALTGVSHPEPAAIAAWARAAESAFGGLDGACAAEVAAEGARLTDDWRAPDRAASTVLPSAFEARLEVLAGTLDAALDDPATFDSGLLRDLVRNIGDHRLAQEGHGRTRFARARLAARLATWLTQRSLSGSGSPPAPPSLNVLIEDYLHDGSWVDRARRRVGEGDDTPEAYQAVLTRISAQAHAARAFDNERFARSLAQWSTSGVAGDLADPVVAVESMLEKVVVPLAKRRPVLLVVLDGCGLAQFRELAAQFPAFGLAGIGPAKADQAGRGRVGLAALPTVTAVSRTSLLSGRLVVGTQDDEKRNLPAHPAVAGLEGPPAVVFHRGDLTGGSGTALPQPVREALAADGPALVAAVVNTIDDELSRGTFSRAYRIEDLDPLAGLLRAAADGGRTVVVTADHGHVLGVGMDGRGEVAKGGEGGDRWRLATRPATGDEVLLTGPRVLEGGGDGILAPWGEDLRYSAKHGGYHGGATPDETLVPLAVFRLVGVEPPRGYADLAEVSPVWWDLAVSAAATGAASDAVSATPSPRRGRKAPSKDQVALFEDAVSGGTTGPSLGGDTALRPGGAALVEPTWMVALEASSVYELQLGALSRARFDPDVIRTTLAVLSSRGGTASFAAIAAALDKPVGRLPGMMARLTTILNVDGFGVLTVDNSAQEVRLSEELLIDQFLDEVT